MVDEKRLVELIGKVSRELVLMEIPDLPVPAELRLRPKDYEQIEMLLKLQIPKAPALKFKGTSPRRVCPNCRETVGVNFGFYVCQNCGQILKESVDKQLSFFTKEK